MVKGQLQEQFAQLYQGEGLAAVQKIRQLLKKSNSTELHLEAATRLSELGFVEEALEIIQPLARKKARRTDIKLFLAELYIEANQEDEALAILYHIEVNDPDFIQAVLLKADVYLQQGLYEVAEDQLAKALQFYPEETVLQLALGEVFYLQEKYHLALLRFQQAPIQSYLPKLADCYAHVGEFEQALELYEQVLKEQEHPDYLYAHALVAIQQQNLPKAIHSLDKLIQLDPFYTSAYPELIEAYHQEKNIEQAVAVLEQGLIYDETNPRLYYLQGLLLVDKGQKDAAKKAWLHCLTLDDTYISALEELLALSNEEEEWADGLAYVNSILEILPERADLYVSKGKILEEMEEWAEAKEVYLTALQLNDQLVEALNALAFLVWEEGNQQEALPWFKQSLALDNEQWEIAEMVERIEKENQFF